MAFPFYAIRTDRLGRRLPHVQVGNRCGHHPDYPRFDCIQDPALDQPGAECDVYGRKFRPAILRDLGNRAKGIYTHPQRHLSWAFKRVDHQIKCRGANLLQDRSELREAKVALLATMALHMDLLTMRVGYYDRQGKFYYRTTQWLANQAGISLDRAKTVLRWMRSEGILVKPKDGKTNQYERAPDGSYRGRGSVKMLSERVFDYFGLGGDYLKAQRDLASKRARARREEHKLDISQQAQAVAQMRQEALFAEMRSLTSGKRQASQPAPDMEQARKRAEVASEAAAAGFDFASLKDLLSR